MSDLENFKSIISFKSDSSVDSQDDFSLLSRDLAGKHKQINTLVYHQISKTESANKIEFND